MLTAIAAGRLVQRAQSMDADQPAVDILGQTADLLRPLIGFDACAITATDPVTVLPSTAAHIESLPAWSCGPYWDAEYLTPTS